MSGDIELGMCAFCREVKPLDRTYLHGCDQTDKVDGFIIIHHCHDCYPREIKELEDSNDKIYDQAYNKGLRDGQKE